MKKLYLIKNQELFQGEKYLKTNQNYFEGWYFKNSNQDNSISFIPGISINEKEKIAFIQVITNELSYFINYDIEEFIFHSNPFYIKIKDNYFSMEELNINIKDDYQDINVYGKIRYLESKNINTNTISPNIMGPFSYVPFMECNHAIISMKNEIEGSIIMDNKKIDLNHGIGYIEKDWGCSFPKKYLWCQANNFNKNKASFMFSVADIPFKLFEFQGLICVLIINDTEYKFTTYNRSKLIEYQVNKDSIYVTIKKGDYYLNIKLFKGVSHKLSAPVKGKMNKDIFETISATINVSLRKGKNIIFSDESTNCGLEIV